MRLAFGVILAALVLACSPARAQLMNIAAGGIWATFAGDASGTRVCQVQGAVSGYGGDVGHSGNVTLAALSSDPKIIRFSVQDSTWTPRSGQTATLVVAFDMMPSLQLPAVWRGAQIQADMVSDRLIPWMHGFTAGQRMTLSVLGEETPPLIVPLAGTTKTINAMSECTKLAGFNDLPRPFTPPVIPTTDGTVAPFSVANEAPPERSPFPRRVDKCQPPEVAKMIMQTVEGMTYAKNRNLEVVDIEGLREFSNNDPKALLSCRGVFVFTSGPRISAAFIRKINVAGDVIFSFSPD